MSASGIAIPSPTIRAPGPPAPQRLTTVGRMLLACGIAAPLLYGAMVVFVPLAWDGYSSVSQTVSELSAIDAPTRPLWVPLGIAYTILVAAFGWGIWTSAGGNRRLRVVGALLLACGVIGAFWPPMHLRGTVFTLTDTLHIVWMAVSGLLTLVAMGVGAGALGKRFRTYCVTSLAVLLATVALTSVDAPKIAANLPTPWVGVWERIGVAVWMLWLAVLAIALLRHSATAASSKGDRSAAVATGGA